jgi:hypothetical protein
MKISHLLAHSLNPLPAILALPKCLYSVVSQVFSILGSLFSSKVVKQINPTFKKQPSTPPIDLTPFLNFDVKAHRPPAPIAPVKSSQIEVSIPPHQPSAIERFFQKKQADRLKEDRVKKCIKAWIKKHQVARLQVVATPERKGTLRLITQPLDSSELRSLSDILYSGSISPRSLSRTPSPDPQELAPSPVFTKPSFSPDWNDVADEGCDRGCFCITDEDDEQLSSPTGSDSEQKPLVEQEELVPQTFSELVQEAEDDLKQLGLAASEVSGGLIATASNVAGGVASWFRSSYPQG